MVVGNTQDVLSISKKELPQMTRGRASDKFKANHGDEFCVRSQGASPERKTRYTLTTLQHKNKTARKHTLSIPPQVSRRST